jgi:Flp pilus assembly protein TadG
MSLLQRFRRDEGGNLAIIAGITLPVAIGAVGAAVSFSSGNATRTDMQMALDAAVLAGVSDSNTGDPINTAQNVFQSSINHFAKSMGSNISASFSFNGTVLSGTGSGSVTNPFGGLIGTKTYTVTTKAAATKQTTPVCVLGLNGLDNGSFDQNGNSTFNAPTCAVQANTTSRTGMTQEGQPTAVAKKFGVTGGHTGSNYSTPPVDGSPKTADPYASLPFPYYSTCGNGKATDVKKDTTLSPGTYCGGIHVFASANLTLQPGIYVMVDGPFWVDGSSTVTGDQVMIAFTGKGSTLQIWGNSTMTVTSPTSGTYMNMQFMQDGSNDSTKGLWASIGGGSGDASKLQYDGVAYFPTQNFWVFGNAVVNANSPSVAIVADKIWAQGGATLNVTNANTRNLPVTVPQSTIGARLIN